MFLETLNVQRMILIGHDLGGVIGFVVLLEIVLEKLIKVLFRWTFAYYYPKMVEKFVCVSAPHPNHYWKKTKKDKDAPIDYSWIQFAQVRVFLFCILNLRS